MVIKCEYAMKKHVYILPRNTDTDWFSLVVYHFYISINYMYNYLKSMNRNSLTPRQVTGNWSTETID